MADLFMRRGSDKWQAYCWFWSGGHRHRVPKSTGIRNDGSAKSRQTAQIIADQIERDFALGKNVSEGPRKTLKQALTALTQAAELAGRTQHTLDNIFYRGQTLVSYFDESKQLGDIDADALREYAVWSRGQGRGAWTVHRELVTLWSAFDISGIAKPDFPDLGDYRAHKPQRVLELDEQRAFLLTVPGYRRLNVCAYLLAGLRLSEPWKLVDVDWEARYMSVQGTKTVKNRRAPREVPIPEELFEMMWPRRKELPVFPKWHLHSIDVVIRRSGKRAGISDSLSANDLRGTYATHMARAGVPQLTLAGIMGNSVKMLDEVYAQVNKRGDHLHEAAAKLPRLTQAKKQDGQRVSSDSES
jgi:integrase